MTKENYEVKVGDKFYPPKGIPLVVKGELDTVRRIAKIKLIVSKLNGDIAICSDEDDALSCTCQFFIKDIKDYIIREHKRLPTPKLGPPTPLREMPEKGDHYWSFEWGYIADNRNIFPMKCEWHKYVIDKNRFNAGLCWKTEAEAQAFCNWLEEVMRSGKERSTQYCPICRTFIDFEAGCELYKCPDCGYVFKR